LSSRTAESQHAMIVGFGSMPFEAHKQKGQIMKKYFVAAVLVLVSVGMFITAAPAQHGGHGETVAPAQHGGHGETVAPAQHGAHGEKPRQDDRKGRRDDMMAARLTKELDLTDEQKAQILPLFKAHHKTIANWWRENAPELKTLHQKAAEAQEAGKAEQAQAIRKKIHERMEESRKQSKDDLLQKLSDVLSPEQLAKAKDLLQHKPISPPLPIHPLLRTVPAICRVELTEAQKVKVKAILDEALKEVKNTLTDKQRDQLKNALGRRVKRIRQFRRHPKQMKQQSKPDQD